MFEMYVVKDAREGFRLTVSVFGFIEHTVSIMFRVSQEHKSRMCCRRTLFLYIGNQMMLLVCHFPIQTLRKKIFPFF